MWGMMIFKIIIVMIRNYYHITKYHLIPINMVINSKNKPYNIFHLKSQRKLGIKLHFKLKYSINLYLRYILETYNLRKKILFTYKMGGLLIGEAIYSNF